MSTWIDHRAIIEFGAEVGNYSKVWAFAHIMNDVLLGEYCSVGGCAEIGRGSKIGDHTRIGYGTFLPNNSRIGNYCFIGPRVVFTDDKFPVVENDDYEAQPPVVEDHASIGAGAVILPGIRIGHHAMIGAGAVVTHDVDPYDVIVGNPGRHLKIKEKPYVSGN